MISFPVHDALVMKITKSKQALNVLKPFLDHTCKGILNNFTQIGCMTGSKTSINLAAIQASKKVLPPYIICCQSSVDEGAVHIYTLLSLLTLS